MNEDPKQDDPEDEEDTDLQTPDGNDADERCPICSRPNAPGCCDTCKHYCAVIEGYELDWVDSDEVDTFMSHMEELCLVEEEFNERFSYDEEAYDEILAKAFGNRPALSAFTTLKDHNETNVGQLFTAIMSDHLVYGEVIRTDGMLSGAYCSLYITNAKAIAALNTELARGIKVFCELAEALPDLELDDEE